MNLNFWMKYPFNSFFGYKLLLHCAGKVDKTNWMLCYDETSLDKEEGQ